MGVRHAVMSPGSRNAPLILSFARNEKIKKYIIPDERSAGFVALGIAQHTQEPVVLCCTSGTALLNYAPAISEAYYRQIPLIILSADRPPELIDQRDGQTIRQLGALSNHVKDTVQLPMIEQETDSEAYINTLANACSNAIRLPKGPVHINIPFKEPFYPHDGQQLSFNPSVIFSNDETIVAQQNDNLSDLLTKTESKVLVLIGQQYPNASLDAILERLSKKIPVLRFPLNNISSGFEYSDAFINDQEHLRPDVLITAGLSVLSKKLKSFIRRFPPKLHLHFDPANIEVDTYDSNPRLIPRDLVDFLPELEDLPLSKEYYGHWDSLNHRAIQAINEYFKKLPFSEPSAMRHILNALPQTIQLHLSNSMPVRYADLLGVDLHITTHSNRGTSGIDGCTSTVVGTSLVSKDLQLLITGDIAFFYDRNAFFHNYSLPNLRIIVMNNEGGGIFRLIPGPSGLPELEDYFETQHNRNAKFICQENGLTYLTAHDYKSLDEALAHFYAPSSSAKILEVFTKPEKNQEVYRGLRQYINEQINN